METITIDCDTCQRGPQGCEGCVLLFWLEGALASPVLTVDEQRALGVLVDAGMMPGQHLSPLSRPPLSRPSLSELPEAQ